MSENQRKEGSAEAVEPQPAPHRRHKKHAAHGGAWKVAYADFVTAMMAFFIVMWVLGQEEEVKQAVASYFHDPLGYTNSGGNVVISRTPEPSAGAAVVDVSARLRMLEAEAEQMRDLLAESPALSKILDQIVFDVTDEGIRIEFRDASDYSFFPVGSSQVSPELRETVRLLTPEITNSNFSTVIEGHTDRRPYGNEDYSNWELSADRANSIRRVMLSYGLPTAKISEVRAYADTRPLNARNAFDLKNRRVSILLKDPLARGGR